MAIPAVLTSDTYLLNTALDEEHGATTITFPDSVTEVHTQSFFDGLSYKKTYTKDANGDIISWTEWVQI